MQLLILILAYGVRRNLDAHSRLDAEYALRRLMALFARVPAGQESRVWPGLLLTGVLVVAVWLLDRSLQTSDWSAFSHVLHFLVLVTLMGFTGWKDRLAAYGDAWQRGDMHAAWYHVKDGLAAAQRGSATEPEQLHLAVAHRLIMLVFERYFCLIFWYVLAGPAAVVGIRLLISLRDHWPQESARRRYAVWVMVVSWLPARVLALTFGLAGDLAGWLQKGRRSLLNLGLSIQELLERAASSALTGYALEPGEFVRRHPDDWPQFGAQSLAAVRDLLNRSMLVWISLVALLVITGTLW
ncbi:MAG: regulatory signaling modulator protein AmpE [Marinobacter sp.]|nr:regulatory signaling modulator protein AmpE [Marinobacter sp.]